MALDLSGIDAELASLGDVPGDLDTWAQEQARELRTFDEIDAALEALAVGVTVNARGRAPVAPHTTHVRSSAQAEERRPKSGEINLGEPVQRRLDSGSSELTLLDSGRPRSGSFELPDDDLRTERNEPVYASPKHATEAHVSPISFTLDSEPPQVELTPLAIDPLDDHDDDDDEENKLIALFTEDDVEPDTLVSVEERDPDAEFDALFDEATHPSGIPTRSLELDDEAISPDDLLSGLSGPGERESDALTSSLFNDLEIGDAAQLGDATQLTDSKTLDAHLDPFPSEEELGSSEFEIVLDEDGEAKDLVPSRPPSETNTGADKRPSFLGRLFGRKDDK